MSNLANKNTEHLKQQVLIADKIHQAGIEMLSTHFQVDIKTGLSEAELIEIINNYHAVVVRSATKITAPIIAKAFNLKVIGRAGAGLDNIDVAGAKVQGIEVVNSPDANTQAVAEHTLGLVLALARHLPEADLSLKHGKWKKSALMGTGLYGKTLGIIGFGRIGREVAHRAKAFGMNVLVNQRRLTPELALEAGVDVVDLIDLLERSDFITLHVPLKPETTGLIGEKELALMKPDAYLINTARGGIVDETALLKALNENWIAGAALDVFITEPADESELAQHPRVIATPHIAASTGDAQRVAAITVAKQIIDILTDASEENALSLRILPSEKVIPHEQTDPTRVKRLIERLGKDKTIKNPPIVTEWEGYYVVLDGATRVTALKELGYKYVVAQVVSYKNHKLALKAWNHIIQDIEPEAILSLIDSLPDVQYVVVDSPYIQDLMVELGGLCYLILPGRKVFIIQPAPQANRLDALNNFVAAYIKAADVARTLANDFDTAKIEFPEMSGIFIYPSFTVEQILQISSVGKVVPAGITRFIIEGRVLRLNLDLTRLEKEEPKGAKSTWLNDFVHQLTVKHKIRYYQEPVYLLDE